MGGMSERTWRMKQQLRRTLRDMVTDWEENPAAARAVDLWNQRQARGAEPLLYPTIAAAVRAGKPRLTYRCPGCDLIGDADVRGFDRHPHASISSIIPALRCPRCTPSGPFVKLLRLS
jgi:hypothetical protein